jgi:hypothetical protein
MRRNIVKTLKMTTLAALTALLLAMMASMTTTPIPAHAAAEATSAGNIIDNRITSATINPATSIATIGGAIQCSTPTSYTVTLTPGYQSDRLVPGPASIGLWAEYCTASGCYGFNTESDMRLVPRR